MLGRRGEVIDHEVHQVIGADVPQSRGKQHRENPVFLDGIMQCRNKVFFGNGAFVEELRHQFIFALRNDLHQSLVCFLGGRLQFLWDRTFFALAVSAKLIGVSLHGHKINDAFQAFLVADG